MNVLVLEVLQYYIDDTEILTSNLIYRTELKNEKEYDPKIKQYLKRYIKHNKLTEEEKPNGCKHAYAVQCDNGMYILLGFNIESYEL